MYIYVLVEEKEEYYREGAGSNSGRIKAHIEEASGERCLIVPFEEFDMKAVKELNPRAITMSGFGNHWQTYRVESFLGMDEVLHNADIPIICFCGSHQLLAYSFNKDLKNTALLEDEPMRKMVPEEDLPRRGKNSPRFDVSDYYIADGFFPVRKIKDDPLFAGLPDIMYMRCAHYCEVKQLPKDFEILASTGHCKIEAMKHTSRPLYGTQFHPELYAEPFFDGKKLLENFAAIVDAFWSDK